MSKTTTMILSVTGVAAGVVGGLGYSAYAGIEHERMLNLQGAAETAPDPEAAQANLEAAQTHEDTRNLYGVLAIGSIAAGGNVALIYSRKKKKEQ